MVKVIRVSISRLVLGKVASPLTKKMLVLLEDYCRFVGAVISMDRFSAQNLSATPPVRRFSDSAGTLRLYLRVCPKMDHNGSKCHVSKMHISDKSKPTLLTTCHVDHIFSSVNVGDCFPQVLRRHLNDSLHAYAVARLWSSTDIKWPDRPVVFASNKWWCEQVSIGPSAPHDRHNPGNASCQLRRRGKTHWTWQNPKRHACLFKSTTVAVANGFLMNRFYLEIPLFVGHLWDIPRIFPPSGAMKPCWSKAWPAGCLHQLRLGLAPESPLEPVATLEVEHYGKIGQLENCGTIVFKHPGVQTFLR